MTDASQQPTFLDDTGAPAPTAAGRLGRYAITGTLGQGGMGEVLSVRDGELMRDVAAKVSLREADARFLVEARVTGQLEHPGIIPVHELGRTPEGRPYFTMKRVDGSDLRALIGVPGSVASRLRIFLKVCEAMAFAHSRGVIHRDLKPGNIMVGDHGEVLVVDWGLAKLAGQPDFARDAVIVSDRDDDGPLQTLDGTVVGTPAYMPPEQARGEIDALDGRADIYSLGAILYELLTGQAPYQGESAWKVLVLVTEGKLVPPSERAPIPWELEAVILRAMAANRFDRYARVEEMAADITAYLDGRALSAAEYRPWQRALKWLRRHRLVAGALLAGALTTAAVAAWHVRDRRQEIDAARAAIAAARPTRVFADAATLQAYATRQLSARRRLSAPARERLARQLARLHDLWSRHERLRRAGADDRATRRQTLRALGELALAGEDFAMADLAARQLDDGALRARVKAARVARRDGQLARVDALLADAGAGKLEVAARYQEALVELAGYRERAVVERLTRELDAISARLRDAAISALSDAAPEQAEVVRDWVARLRSGEASKTPMDQRILVALGALGSRAAPEARTARERAMAWLRGLADAQRPALLPGSDHGERRLQLICEALGHLADASAAEALTDYLWIDWAELRCVPAGVALARLARTSRDAAVLLDALLEPSPTLGRRARRPSVGRWWTSLRRQTDVSGLAQLSDLKDTGKESFFQRALRRSRAGALTELEADVKEALRRWPDAADTHVLSGLLLAANKRYAGAIAAYEKALQINPEHPAALTNLLTLAIHTRKYGLAARIADRAVARSPDSAIPLRQRAELHIALGRLEAAKSDLDDALALDPTNTEALCVRGTLHMLSDPRKGHRDYAAALKSDPANPQAQVGLARALRVLGKLDAALAAARKSVGMAPHLAATHAELAAVLARRGQRAEAAAAYDRAIAQDAHLPQALLGRARLRIQQRAWSRALEDLAVAYEALAAPTGRAQVHVLRARVYVGQGRLDLAIQELGAGLAIVPDHQESLLARSRCYLDSGDSKRALADAERLVSLRPERLEFLEQRAECYVKTGQLARAFADYERALGLARTNRWRARILHNRGAAHLHFNKDPRRAIVDLDTSLSLDDSASTRHLRGRARAMVGNAAGAAADFARAVELAPGDVDSRLQLGVMLTHLGRAPEGLKHLDRVVQARPQQWDARMARGHALGVVGRTADAIAELETARSLAPARHRAIIDQLLSSIRRQ